MTGWIALAVAVAALGWVVLTYNGLVRRRLQTSEAWSQIDVQLRRRQDLIPNLVETARGYMAHERGVLMALTEQRAAAAAAGDDVPARERAESALAGAIGDFRVRAEAYPDLKASQAMLRLQEDLTSAEGRIAMARRRFNDAVRDYNIAAAQLPGALVAGAFGFRPLSLFEADASARSPVAVDLGA
jgi:LemA protein